MTDNEQKEILNQLADGVEYMIIDYAKQVKRAILNADNKIESGGVVRIVKEPIWTDNDLFFFASNYCNMTIMEFQEKIIEFKRIRGKL